MFTIILFTNWQTSQASIRFTALNKFNSEFNIQVVRSIAQDKSGQIWIGSGFDGIYSFDGHSIKHFPLSFGSLPASINDIHLDQLNRLWVATSNKGMLQLNQGKFIPKFPDMSENIKWVDIDSDSELGLWLVSEQGLYQINGSNQLKLVSFIKSDNESLTSVKIYEKKVWIGTTKGLYKHSISSATSTLGENNQFSGLEKTNDFDFDYEGNLWIAAENGLFKSSNPLDEYPKLELMTEGNFKSLAISDKFIWAGTIYQGLLQFNLEEDSKTWHTSHKADEGSLNEDNILSLYIDQDNSLWVGSFNQSLNFMSLDALAFGLYRSIPSELYCAVTDVVFGFYEFGRDWWVATEKGLVKFTPSTGECLSINHDPNKQDGLSHYFIYSLSKFTEDYLWVSTARGLNTLDLNTYQINQLSNKVPRTNTYFTHNYDADNALIGTKEGLYIFNHKEKSSRLLGSEIDGISQVSFFNAHQHVNGMWYFATNKGLYLLDETLNLKSVKKVNDQLPQTELMAVHSIGDNRIWLGSDNYGLFLFDLSGTLLKHFGSKDGISSDVTIYTILDHGSKLWLGTSDGLISLDIVTNRVVTFNRSDGLQDNFFNMTAAYKAEDSRLFFGGRGGFNAFYSDDIFPVSKTYDPKLTDFKLFNEVVVPGEKVGDFSISKTINELDSLILSYQELVIGFEFNVIEFIEPNKIHYAYQLVGFDDTWRFVDASNRQASYTNLPAGEYVFQVKATADTYDWDQPIKAIKIVVLPAPWLTWWAITIYVLLFFSLLGWFIYRKISADAKLTELLRTEVDEKTRELNTQKRMVESLLAKKNELFSHISHEFRTPLTLILGPINDLINKQTAGNKLSALKLVNKSANRLLLLVEQLLQIAKVSSFDKVKFFQQQTSEPIASIVDSFQHVARKKNINLELINNESALIAVTDQCLDAILGNLISNAIKYSPKNSRVLVSTRIIDNKFELSVADQGPGLTPQQQSDVFKIFSRLDEHADIGGVGIGLAVVDEMVKINHGHIHIKSEKGEGARFIVQIPLTTEPVTDESNHYIPSTLVEQLSQESTSQSSHTDTTKQSSPLVSGKDTLLIIEDNLDMRRFIVGILEEQYHCIEAKNGQIGVKQAIEYIPDMVICDVMMPLMGGFEVSRAIRSDEKTSHIPLLLLTALNDKNNRIKGWKENIDSYMTKPFDQDELLIRIENILSVRNILKKKASFLLDQGQANQIKLAKKDQEFVDKLNHIIKLNFNDPLLTRSKMAKEMAVSDRQLQRKLKALIDQNPMDYLRIYRLNKAKSLLKDGYQVSQVSDDCGFNSLSYFSYCFKAQYGKSPKAFQEKSN